MISLENTLNGTIMPLEEMQRIHGVARKHDIKIHLDGARLWNASQQTKVPLSEYGQLADTVSVCVSKGVGAPIGSLLVGSSQLVRRARHMRKLMGGGWRQAGLLAKVAHHCIDTVVPTMYETHRLTKTLASALERMGMRTLLPVDTNMIFLDVSPLSVMELADALKESNIVISRDEGSVTRLVLHHQIDAEAVSKFVQTASKLLKTKERTPSSHRSVDISKAYPSASVKV